MAKSEEQLAWTRAWRAANKEHVAAYNRSYRERYNEWRRKRRAENRDAYLADRRAYYAANKEREQARIKRNRDKHRDKYNKQTRDYRQALPLLVKLQRRASRAKRLEHYREMERKASRRAKRHGLTLEERQQMYALQDGKCKLCRQPLNWEEIRIDHNHACCNKQQGCKKCVRGMVHRDCNILIGIVENRGITIEMAQAYLEPRPEAPFSAMIKALGYAPNVPLMAARANA